MCGIAGILSTSMIRPEGLDGMVQTLRRRGPDAQGTWLSDNGHAWLGHTRLSIIDLSAAANQPFHSADGRRVIVFNGEIYNFRALKEKLRQEKSATFTTNSDTEVILAAFEAWGPEMVNQLDGMFAIAIYDKQSRRLFLFRDRMGKKPLFYFVSGQCIAFASEIKSLMQLPQVNSARKVCIRAISSYLHLGYIPEPLTIYERLFKLRAGHYMVIDESLHANEVKYWTVTENGLTDKINPGSGSSLDVLRDLLIAAVKKRLVADVPVGTFLSGGVDSSLVAAIANQEMGSPIKTFSVGFTDKKFNESGYARKVAGILKTDHHELLLEESKAREILPEYLSYFDEPFADPSAIPVMLVSKLARKDVKVVLTGDGGDELFQGYGAYTWARRLQHIPHAVKPLIRSLLKMGNNRLQRAAGLFEDISVGGVRSHIASQEQYYFSQEEIRTSVLRREDWFYPFEYSDGAYAGLSSGEYQAIFDLQYYLKDDLLVKVDRASMYESLECRCPLLDREFVTYALQLPLAMKRNGRENKWALKQLLQAYLPDELIYRPKWGFGIPVATWLKGDLKYLVVENLSPASVEATGVFNPEHVKSLVHQFRGGKDYLYNKLWLMMVLQRWMLTNQMTLHDRTLSVV